MQGFNPILSVAIIVVILNLGAPLDYHLILGAGLYTVIYIFSRACDKYTGAFFGAAVTRSPKPSGIFWDLPCYRTQEYHSSLPVLLFRYCRSSAGICKDYSRDNCSSGCYK